MYNTATAQHIKSPCSESFFFKYKQVYSIFNDVNIVVVKPTIINKKIK